MRLLAAPVIEPSQRATRIQSVERDIVLPLRVVTITILGYYFFFSGWFDTPGASNTSDWVLRNAQALKAGFVAYAIFHVVMGTVLVLSKNLSLGKIQWMVFVVGLVDALMMGTLTFLTKGFDSYFYWVFPALILHNALAIPVAFPQLLLNFFVCLGF